MVIYRGTGPLTEIPRRAFRVSGDPGYLALLYMYFNMAPGVTDRAATLFDFYFNAFRYSNLLF